MSYFYLKPIQGNVSLHVLEECVLQRWKYFLNSFRDLTENNGGCQYLIEGSVYDNIGHFSLNYLSMCSSNEFLINSVLKYEEELFHRRLMISTPNNVRLLCKCILKYTKSMPNNSNIPYIDILEQICRKMILKHVACHVLSKEHSRDCNTYSLQCHFTLCLNLLKKRLIEINNGVASIPCGKWMIYFKEIFRMHLHYRNNSAAKETINNIDPRCREIIFKLNQTMSNNDRAINKLAINHRQIDDLANYFPLCMKSLHFSLRNKHRLSHNERFRYSLFLKDIGMTMKESILFWQYEYSKPSSHHTTCCHDWKKNSKKYVYGIRHLYGLEGSRKNYSMASCNTIQNSAFKEGGCPFKHHDDQKLQALMNKSLLNANLVKDVTQLKQLGRCGEACSLYKNSVLLNLISHRNIELDETKFTSTLSPINYFKDVILIKNQE